MLAAIPRCPALGPLRMDISQSNTPAKLPRHRFAAVGHRVGLDKPWAAHIPVLVRMGIWLRNKVPGRVSPLTRPRAPHTGPARGQAADRYSPGSWLGDHSAAPKRVPQSASRRRRVDSIKKDA